MNNTELTLEQKALCPQCHSDFTTITDTILDCWDCGYMERLVIEAEEVTNDTE